MTLAIADGYALIDEVWVVLAEVITMMLSARLSLRYLRLMVNMILMHTLLGKSLLIKNLHAMNFLRIHVLELLLVSSLILLLFGGLTRQETSYQNANNLGRFEMGHAG